jgi:hypothetical protein
MDSFPQFSSFPQRAIRLRLSSPHRHRRQGTEAAAPVLCHGNSVAEAPLTTGFGGRAGCVAAVRAVKPSNSCSPPARDKTMKGFGGTVRLGYDKRPGIPAHSDARWTALVQEQISTLATRHLRWWLRRRSATVLRQALATSTSHCSHNSGDIALHRNFCMTNVN